MVKENPICGWTEPPELTKMLKQRAKEREALSKRKKTKTGSSTTNIPLDKKR